MASKPQLVFLGGHNAYLDWCRRNRMNRRNVLWASSVDAVRGQDLSDATLIDDDSFLRDRIRIHSAMMERGLKE